MGFVIFIIWAAISNIVLVLVTDKLIFIEYRDHPRQWHADGSPRGYYWTPPNPKFNRYHPLSMVNTYRLNWVWKTPDWIRHNQTAYRLLWILRSVHLLNSLIFIFLFTWVAIAFFRS